jgi:MHS family proline/betaine transporter-like MFS transporter
MPFLAPSGRPPLVPLRRPATDLLPARHADALPKVSIAVAALSTIVEWYDFTLYLFMATVLSRVVFGGGQDSLLATLAIFAVSYLLRPVGALLFGRFGDRFGRRPVLLVSMALMAAAMLGTAVLPTHAQAGAVAGGAFLALRCVMAFSVGGEYPAVSTYLLEGARPGRRGLVTALASMASEIGVLLAVAASAITTTMLDRAALDDWGWRIPFAVGALLAVATLAARTSLGETPVFARQQPTGAGCGPLRFILRTQRAGLYRTFAISALASITYYVGIIYVPTYLTSVSGFPEGSSLWLSTTASVTVIVVTPYAGAISDRIGRRTTLLWLCVVAIALPVPMFALMSFNSVGAALCAAAVLACTAGGITAVGASAAAEQFHPAGRLTGLALGATAATAVFGGLAPYLATLLTQATGWTLLPGALVAAVALSVLPVLARMPETSGQA